MLDFVGFQTKEGVVSKEFEEVGQLSTRIEVKARLE